MADDHERLQPLIAVTTGMPVESRMRGNAHVRFGGRPGETDRPKGRHRAPGPPNVFRHNRRGTPMAAFQTLLGLSTTHRPTTYHQMTQSDNAA